MKLKYICAQPADDFFIWQVETLIVNFMSVGINPADIHILLAINNGIIPNNWKTLCNHHSQVGFFFYEDLRIYKHYTPSVYFHLMKHHLAKFPELKDEALFLHDSDIALTRRIDFEEMLRDKSWYLSDTNSYIQYDYIQQKGNHVYLDMCAIIGIDPLIPKLMRSHSGGAQYLTKGTDAIFWNKVENDSIKLYDHFNATEHLHVKKHKYDYPIQKWTAGMWSLLWNAWLHGHETKVDKRLDFGWSPNHIMEVGNYPIIHNAGVLADRYMFDKLFYKNGFYSNLPYNYEFELDDTKVSSWYFNEVKKAGKQSPLMNQSNIDTISPSLAGRIGNNLFMVANAYARAKEQGKQLKLNINEVDKTDDYVGSVFRDFDFSSDTKNNTIYSGYFQSEQYFKQYASEIKIKFGPTEQFKERIKAEMLWLFTKKVACINVRKGDYLNFKDIHPTLSVEYIDYCICKLEYADVYLVISDDINWCKRNIKLSNILFLEGYNTYEQLWIMSMCSDFIISNSSFSWWGAYLSTNPSKKVLAPMSWFGKSGPEKWEEIYFDECEKIPTVLDDGLIRPSKSNNFISVLTLTYKRKELLEEAIMSFLMQDYANSEMVIVNDDPDVTYVFNHPKVVVINLKERFKTIAEKFEYAYRNCRGEFIYRLDDDDLLMPNALRKTSIDINLNPGFDIYRGNGLYFFSDNKFEKKCSNVNNGNVFSVSYLNRISFAPKNIGEDVDMVFNQGANIFNSKQGNPTMIYRWGMSTYHVSSMDESMGKTALEQIKENTENTPGITKLVPTFRSNYYQQINT